MASKPPKLDQTVSRLRQVEALVGESVCRLDDIRMALTLGRGTLRSAGAQLGPSY